VSVSVPNLRVGADRYRVGFHSPEGTGHDAMPAKRADDEADKLFGTPGGLYTAADIQANGTRPPGEKYKGVRAKHDTEPKPGDKICPISETLANPQFTWVVGGKTYEFCCTPCIEEFVAAAKEKPESIQPPESYRKK
jgi:YHS domain-containing protein